MKEETFNRIQSKFSKFKFSSMNYIDYEDICNYEVKVENDNIILIYGFNYEKETACQFKQAVFYICNYYFYEL